jgi:hypothetical protein
MNYLASAIVCVAFSTTLADQERTYDDAYKVAKKLDKKIMVIFSTKG